MIPFIGFFYTFFYMFTKATIRVASRPSKLAVTQTKQVIEILQKENPSVNFELQTFKTEGDKDYISKLTDFGGVGVFVKELESALLEGKADIAVHSLKDVPSVQPEGLCLASFPRRENPNDVLLTRDNWPLLEMPDGFVVGTGSPRRVVQLKALRKDAVFSEIRGNIETRLKKLHDGEYDAIVLAAAGLNRLGIEFDEFLALDIDHFIPAVGQGALAIECRSDDVLSKKIAMSVNHQKTEISVKAEREFMRVIEGGCKLPMAAYAYYFNRDLFFNAMVGDVETGRYLKRTLVMDPESSFKDAADLARSMKEECREIGINVAFD